MVAHPFMVQMTEQARANYEFNRHHDYKKNEVSKGAGFDEILKASIRELKKEGSK